MRSKFSGKFSEEKTVPIWIKCELIRILEKQSPEQVMNIVNEMDKMTSLKRNEENLKFIYKMLIKRMKEDFKKKNETCSEKEFLEYYFGQYSQ